MDVKEFQKLRELDHRNVVKVFGFCIDTAHLYILTEFASKGSLMDILENEDIHLDWDFKYCLLLDILRGLEYIFHGGIKYHGNLKSSNCVVDGRFVLKLADIGPRRWINSKERCARDLLWTSPEILKCPRSPSASMGQAGDVYSLGIMMHEIIQRNGPFSIESGGITPEKIIESVVNQSAKPFRPVFEVNSCPAELMNVIKSCWLDVPTDRTLLKDIVKGVNDITQNKFKQDNFFDNLLKRMEQYANNLEEIVGQRTDQYLHEKRKAENLLYQLLPKSIAIQIQSTGSVEPEWFQSVTIMFSDIVHFTSLSAESSPMEIVQMLNELYSAFDDTIDEFDVYKVETIGDAYMCVSGLPQRNTYHFKEMAKLSVSILTLSDSFVIKHRPDTGLKLRVGMHSGSCVAGVIGQKMPRYCLFGDTVNTASRMESTSEACSIQVSDVTAKMLLDDPSMLLTRRGEVEVKEITVVFDWERQKITGIFVGARRKIIGMLSGNDRKLLQYETKEPITTEDSQKNAGTADTDEKESDYEQCTTKASNSDRTREQKTTTKVRVKQTPVANLFMAISSHVILLSRYGNPDYKGLCSLCHLYGQSVAVTFHVVKYSDREGALNKHSTHSVLTLAAKHRLLWALSMISSTVEQQLCKSTRDAMFLSNIIHLSNADITVYTCQKVGILVYSYTKAGILVYAYTKAGDVGICLYEGGDFSVCLYEGGECWYMPIRRRVFLVYAYTKTDISMYAYAKADFAISDVQPTMCTESCMNDFTSELYGLIGTNQRGADTVKNGKNKRRSFICDIIIKST
ncbi:Atrial natriuretic peptide receptor 1 [Mizuhopecten yessoensis]|uniref:Guanylate cyclase n=1 Tax=Mizuhopecten yessoensis TaxID=6573 RepID=A0A210QIX7_MIZYE|nr:Atrial natriuretic peptide receptor 1 [Mizuhopecten yessoensis]